MRKIEVMMIGLALVAGNAKAYNAVARFQAAQGQRIQVMLDGKIINKIPLSIVRIKSRPGVHDVRIKVFDRRGLVRWVYRDKITVKNGFISEYALSFNRRSGIQLKKIGMNPIHLNRYRRPDKFYNKKNLAYNNNWEMETLRKVWDSVMA